MAECYTSKNDLKLLIQGSYLNTLDIESFSLMLKNPSYCYKFFWLEAIVKLISQDVRETTFDEIIDEMISNAWYPVREFHIHLSGFQLGEIRDGLERAVLQLSELSGLPSNASPLEIKNAIHQYADQLKPFKNQLTNMVPYRALAGFFNRFPTAVNWESTIKMVQFIEDTNRQLELPYTMGASSKLNREVYFSPAWMKMIQDNTVSILGWIQYEKLKWLQANNPEVPGLVYKLAPLDEKMRKLGKVRSLWSDILEIQPLNDIFTAKPIDSRDFDVDHFIPWSFVMNDELWNLMPMDSSLNSSKSNRLPKWDPFFVSFAENQYLLYSLIHEYPLLHKRFEACYKDNLHSIWASQELYRAGNSKEEFCNILQKNMRPVYDSAKRQGYELWNF